MKHLRTIWIGLAAALVISVSAQAQNSPAGTWAYTNNGHVGNLALTVDSAGNVTGTMTDTGVTGNPVKGFWDSSSLKLTFYRAINGTTSETPPDFIEIFTGYMFPCNVSAPAAQCLAGTFEAFAGTGATAQKTVFGWFGKQVAP